MMKIKNIILCQFFALIFSNGYALSKDSFNRFITLNFSKQNLETFSFRKNNLDIKPISNVKQYSFSAMLQKKFLTYKKLNFNTYLGLKGRFINIGSIDVIQLSNRINEKINSRSFDISLNSGVSVDIRVFKFKHSELMFGAGLLTSGYFFNPIKTKKYVYERNDLYKRDSIEIAYYRNNVFEINPFYQLTYKRKYNKKMIIVGLRYFYSSITGSPHNIEYKFFVSTQPTTPKNYEGTIESFRTPLIFFLGLSI
ncbi:MAG: hypothetical protein HQ463_00575 [Bacteroidetes bacterium]|nr:hypothetical protein [Bacteroidota bacterium]